LLPDELVTRWYIAFVTIAGCAGGANQDIAPFLGADAMAPHLHVGPVVGVDVDRPSDLALRDGLLYAVSGAEVVQLARDGQVPLRLDVPGNNLQALAYDPARSQLAYGDESTAVVRYIDVDGNVTDSLRVDDAADAQAGIVALAADELGNLFVGKQKSPSLVIELDAGKVARRVTLDWIDDLSALAFHAGQMYALSDRADSLYRLDGNYQPELGWRLGVPDAEGLAFDGSHIYVASGDTQQLFEFELEEE
jgi:uncharacterized protein YjiK